MPVVVFVLPDGSERAVRAAAGTTLMRAAVDAGVPGVLGDCGGCLDCATCHVLLERDVAARLPPAAAAEEDLLGFVAAGREAGSRLGCQVALADALDGIRVRIPVTQV